MAISKEKKANLVDEYVKELKQSEGLILADYRGLGVGDLSTLRHTMRPIGGKLVVIKNRLLKLALAQAGASVPDEWLIGPTAISFCHGEVQPVAKALIEATNELETLRIKGGVMGDSVMTDSQVKMLASLPSREVLLTLVLGTMSAPASRTAGVVASGIRQVLNVLQAYVDKLQESAPAALAAPAAGPA